MVEYQRPMHRQIEEIDPGWFKSEIIAMARSALIAVGLSLTIGIAVSQYVSRGKPEVSNIVVAPQQSARGALAPTSCAGAPSRCAKPAASR